MFVESSEGSSFKKNFNYISFVALRNSTSEQSYE